MLLQLADADPAGLARLAQAKGLSGAQRAAALAVAGPSTATRTAVLARLKALGLRVDDANRYGVMVSGPSPLVDAVFGHAPGRFDGPHAGRSTARGAVVPNSIAGLVKFALSSDQPALHMHPMVLRDSTSGAPSTVSPRTVSSYLTPQPGEVTGARARALYGDPASTGVISKPGLTIATIQFSGWNSSDLTSYAAAQVPGLPDPIAAGQYTPVNFNLNPALPDGGGGDIEVALDQESLLATAPNADQRAYFIANGSSSSAYVMLLDQIATDAASVTPRITALSISWGLCEQGYSNGDIPAMDSGFQTLTAAGVTVFAASGDAGSYDCDHLGSSSPVAPKTLAVDYPGSSPYVVSVGGLTTASPETPPAPGESAWWDGTSWGGGGGQSSVEIRPAWQPGSGSISGTGRLVPDISLAAVSSFGPFAVFTSDSGVYGCNWCGIGGTSLASPLAAASLTNIQLATDPTTNSQLGAIGPLLYGAASSRGAFRDTSAGTNGGFAALAGYDEASGLGAPNWSGIWWSSAWQTARPHSRFPTYVGANTAYRNIPPAPALPVSGTYSPGYQAGTGTPNTDPSAGTWTTGLPTTLSGVGDGTLTPWVEYRYADGRLLTVSGSTVLDTTPPTASPTTTPATPNGTNGWFRTNVAVAWNWADATSGVSPTCTATTLVSVQGSSVPASGSCRDNIGNQGAATLSLKIDKTAPTVTTSGGLSPTSGTRASIHWAGADSGSGVAGYQVRLVRVGTTTNLLTSALTTSTWAGPYLTRGTTFVFTARSVDKAGNTSASSAFRFAVPLAAASFSFSSGWGITYAPGSIAGVRRVASKLGSAASIWFTAKQYKLLFTTCPSCGEVAVYLDGRLSRVVSTYSSTTRDQVASYYVSFLTAGRHSLYLKVLHAKVSASSGYYVMLDGLMAVN